MGFWSGLGKIALKAAPIATAFIPGVGPLASAAIGGATSAASKKLSGGSWGQALGAGALGAGTSYGLDKLTAAKGIGPSNPIRADVKGLDRKIGNMSSGGGFMGGLKKAATNPWVMGGTAAGLGALALGKATGGGGGGNQGFNQPMPNYEGMMPGLGPSPLMMRNQNFPNLAESLNAGRQAAYQRYPYSGNPAYGY